MAADKVYTVSEYREKYESLVDFSFKLTNTNVKGGIRLAETDSKLLPYVSLLSARADQLDSKQLTQKIWPDYCRNSATEAKPFKHLRVHRFTGLNEEIAVLESKLKTETKKDKKKQIKDSIKKKKDYLLLQEATQKLAVTAMQEPVSYTEQEAEILDARLPQLLVEHPGSDDGYIAFTPVLSAGLAEHFKANRPQNSDQRLLFRKIGGENSQNAGGLVNAMTTTLVLNDPFQYADPALKKALSIWHRGVALSLAHPLQKKSIKSYFEYRKTLLEKEKSSLQSQYYQQQNAEKFLETIHSYLNKLRIARRHLQGFPEFQEESAIDASDSSLSELSRSYCSLPVLSEVICKKLASVLVEQVRAFSEHQLKLALGLNEAEKRSLQQAIVEVIYE